MSFLWWATLVLYVLGGGLTVTGLLLARRRAVRSHQRIDEDLTTIEGLIGDAERRRNSLPAGSTNADAMRISAELQVAKARVRKARLKTGTLGYAADYAERTLYAELKAPAALAIGGVALGTVASVMSLWL